VLGVVVLGVVAVGILSTCSVPTVPTATRPMPSAATAVPTRTLPPSPTPSPAPDKAARSILYVAHTDGEGVYIRKTPQMADRLLAWPEGTALEVIGDTLVEEDLQWVPVRAPDGQEGLVPEQYTDAVAPTPEPTAAPTVTPRPSPTAQPSLTPTRIPTTRPAPPPSRQGLPPPDYMQPPTTATDEEACNLVRFAIYHPEWWQRQVLGWDVRSWRGDSDRQFWRGSDTNRPAAWLASYLLQTHWQPEVQASWVTLYTKHLDGRTGYNIDWPVAEQRIAAGAQRCGISWSTGAN